VVEASVATNESQDMASGSKAWLRRMICRARIEVLDGIIIDSQAVPKLAGTLPDLRRVRAHYVATTRRIRSYSGTGRS